MTGSERTVKDMKYTSFYNWLLRYDLRGKFHEEIGQINAKAGKKIDKLEAKIKRAREERDTNRQITREKYLEEMKKMEAENKKLIVQ